MERNVPRAGERIFRLEYMRIGKPYGAEVGQPILDYHQSPGP